VNQVGWALIVAAGCGGSAAGSATPAPTWPDASACGTIPSSELSGLVNPATGSLSGPDLGAVICPNGASAYIEPTPAGMAPYYFDLTWTTGASAAPDFAFQRPAAAFAGELDAFLGMSAPAPGTYAGPGGPGVQWVTFTFYLPAPSSVHCESEGPLGCSAGCGRVCPAYGCGAIPCVPAAPSVNYSAPSWTLTLTSVTQEADSGLSTPHGTLTATMVEDDAGANAADLSVTF
jgi:hypothetical protein